jgi:beta-lactamase class D
VLPALVKRAAALAALLMSLCFGSVAEAKTLCLLVADAASGKVLIEEGDCHSRVTPASTTKIPLALMGFDSGFLTSTSEPALPFKKGYADWAGPEWRQTTDPTYWMKHSVVWYSHRITEALGARRLTEYAEAFRFGNADFSGDPGQDNGLERAWISSSLQISPLEQVAFLRRFVTRKLPVSDAAINLTAAIMEQWPTSGGWSIAGKTGSAFPRKANGSFDRSRAWGWFVGWAQRDGRTLVFARLDQDTEQRASISSGRVVRDALLAQWDGLVADLP